MLDQWGATDLNGVEADSPATSGAIKGNDSETEGGAVRGAGIRESDASSAGLLDPPRKPPSSRATAKSGSARSWSQRCELLFEEMQRPARAMVRRAYGRALSDEELDDVYSAAWAATLSALRTRGSAMSDDELRAYLLTAVASHASKELRRRSRKPAAPLEDAHNQVISDHHDPLPDERVIGTESSSIARDLLLSLPPRRRAVMLLRYGWGLAPKDVCVLVSGLSPRAYRKEITKGVEQLIDRLKQVESGEWCETREPILRDYVAGTASAEVQRQASQHIHHCRACADLVSRLSGHLHDLGSSVALASVAGSIGEQRLSLADRAGGLFDRGRDGTTTVVERGESTLATVAGSGGARGSGVAGAGLFAKVAGLGAAAKTTAVCLGAGAAATACVAAGVVPGLSLDGGEGSARGGDRGAAKRERPKPPSTSTSYPDTIRAVQSVPVTTNPPVDAGAGGGGSTDGDGETEQPEPKPVETSEPAAPTGSTAPTAPPVDQEFGLPSSTAVAPAPASSSSSGVSSGGTSEGAGASGSQIGQEFGP